MSARQAASSSKHDNPALVLAAVVSAFALGYALEQANGYFTPAAMGWLLLAFCAPAAALLLPRARVDGALARAINPCLGAGLIFQASLLTSYPPAKYLKLQRLDELWPLHLGIFAVVGLACAPTWADARERMRAFAMVAAAGLMGGWLVQHSPDPHIDVFTYAKEAATALWRGENPYAIRFADVYGAGKNAYAAGLSDGTQTLVGFPYLPINLGLLALTPALGDPRWLLWAMLLTCAWLMVRFAPCPVRGRLSAAALLCTPRAMMLLEQSFLEPLAIALVAATAVSATRRPAWTPYLLGALLVTKQPMPLLAGTAFLLPGLPKNWHGRLRYAAKTFLSGCALTLPLVLASPQAFWRSAIWVHFMQVRVPDSLTLASYLVHVRRQSVPALWVCMLTLAVTTALWLRRAPRTASTFAMGFGGCYLAFLLFARQAYANYHHQVLASLFIGAAMADFGPRKAQR